jgi:spore germination cell wall hydrolase CwlJ-like protein
MLVATIILTTPAIAMSASIRCHHHMRDKHCLTSHYHKQHIVHVRFVSLNTFLERKRAQHRTKPIFVLKKITEVVDKTYSSRKLALIKGIKLLTPFKREQATCLALTVYHEARGSTVMDQKATAFVVLNRTKTELGSIFGPTICDVVSERRLGAHNMQFSWMSESATSLVPREENSWKEAQQVAYNALNGSEKDITNGAQFFWCPKHSRRQRWMTQGIAYHTFGHHVFMKLSTKMMN